MTLDELEVEARDAGLEGRPAYVSPETVASLCRAIREAREALRGLVGAIDRLGTVRLPKMDAARSALSLLDALVGTTESKDAASEGIGGGAANDSKDGAL